MSALSEDRLISFFEKNFFKALFREKYLRYNSIRHFDRANTNTYQKGCVTMANFDFINNRTFDDRVTAFAPQTPQMIPGDRPFTSVALDTGAKVQPNGDVQFAFYAPKAENVIVVFNLPGAKEPLPLEKGADGIWRGVLPYDPLFCGPKAFTFVVDGAEVISPFCPEFFIYNRTTNYVEIPDPNAPYVLMRDTNGEEKHSNGSIDDTYTLGRKSQAAHVFGRHEKWGAHLD